MKNWTVEKTLEFIKYYETEPVLWNPNEPNYPKRSLHSESWLRIKAKLSFEVAEDELKSKMKSLMGCYRKHANKYKKCMSEEGGSYLTTWFAFPALNRFLGPIYDCQPTTCTEEISEENEIETDIEESETEEMPSKKRPKRDNPTKNIYITSEDSEIKIQLENGWSEEKILEFIKYYEKEPVLWNPNEPNHQKRSLHSESWLRIKAKLSFEVTMDEMKSKMKSLMGYYRNHANKYKKCMLEEGESYHTTWFAFPALNRFLGPIYVCQPTTCTEEISEENEIETDIEESETEEMPSKKRPRRDNPTKNILIKITSEDSEKKFQLENGWSEEKILEFIKYYETEPILWNPNEPNYPKRSLHSESWLSIKDKLSFQVTADELKNKMKSLMSYYRLHANKYKKCMMMGDIYRTNWFAFSAMNKFLGPIYECQPTISSTSETNEDSENEESRRQSKYNLKTTKTRDSSPEIVEEQEMQGFEFVETGASADDEYEIFGKLIAKKLKKIKDYNVREVLMNDIYNLISRACMRDASIKT